MNNKVESPRELHTDGLNPHIAFFLYELASDPQLNLQVDRDRGGLTIHGQIHETGELSRQMHEILERIRQDPKIIAQAVTFRRSIQEDLKKGSVLFSLTDQERQEFFGFLTRNNCALHPFYQNIISTNLII